MSARHRLDGPPTRGSAHLTLILPVGGLGAGLLTLAVVSGHLRYLLTHLPLIPPTNGLTELVFAAACFAAARHLIRPKASASLVDRLVADLDTAEAGPWFGTRADKRVARGPIRDLFMAEEEWALVHYPEDVAE